MECKKKSNAARCACLHTECSRHAVCCDCLHYHLSMSELPACCFPKEIAKTDERSVATFVEVHA